MVLVTDKVFQKIFVKVNKKVAWNIASVEPLDDSNYFMWKQKIGLNPMIETIVQKGDWCKTVGKINRRRG